MKSFLEFLTEAHFNKADFIKHDYLTRVIDDINNGQIVLGNTYAEKTIKTHKIAGLLDVKKIKTVDDFNKITIQNTIPFKWADIFKQPYSGKTAGTDAEFIEVEKINEVIKNNGGLITIYFNGMKLKISKAQKVSGTPKADIALLDENNNEVFWISHKQGHSAKDFQNYGGISEKELNTLTNKKVINNINNFIIGLKILFIDKNGKQLSCYGVQCDEIIDEVVKFSVYGKDSLNTQEFGRNNVNCLCQGNIELVPHKNGFKIDASSHFLENPTLPSKEYSAIFNSRTSNDRQSYGIKGLRIGIFPKVFHSSNKHLLDELKIKYQSVPILAKSKTLHEFITRYFTTNLNDFYHNNDILTIDDIKNYQFK